MTPPGDNGPTGGIQMFLSRRSKMKDGHQPVMGACHSVDPDRINS